jgi:AcrR family transcriptional regulator
LSPAATHTIEEAEQAILGSADDLFYRRGIAAVAMADIRDEAGVSLRRLYAVFPTKADLVAGWLEHRHSAWMRWFEGEIRDRTAAGAAPVDAIFDALGAWLTSSDHRGCGFINALAETAEIGARHEKIISGHKQSVTDLLARFTDQPQALAVIVDGAIVQSSVFKRTDPIEAGRRAAALLIAEGGR